MAGWRRRAIGDLPIYQADTLSRLPGVVQGFTTRRGGFSLPPYDSLNLGGHVGDRAEDTRANQERLLTDLGWGVANVAYAEQVHGNRVGEVAAGHLGPLPGVDALITRTPGILLAMYFADCVPVYLVDPIRHCLGLVHSGWRGAAGNVVGATVQALQDRYGMVPATSLAAIGPCIAGESFEVGAEVAEIFRNLGRGGNTGASTVVYPKNEMSGKYLVNLRQIVYQQLLQAGLGVNCIAVCDADTFQNRSDFFSYRRDGRTGRMCGFLAFRPNAS